MKISTWSHLAGLLDGSLAVQKPSWTSKSSPSGAWKAVWRAKWTPSCAWRPVWRAKWSPSLPPRAPKSAQEPPSWVQEAHKKLQVEPKETPKRPQEKNKRRPTSSKGSLERQECKNMRIELSCRRELDSEGCKSTKNRAKKRQVALRGQFGGQVALGGRLDRRPGALNGSSEAPSCARRAVGQASRGSERRLGSKLRRPESKRVQSSAEHIV